METRNQVLILVLVEDSLGGNHCAIFDDGFKAS